MKIPVGTATAELVIKRSRFIGHASFFDKPGEVKRRIGEVKASHAGCNHVVYAYVVGKAGTEYGMSDAGEPKGTAGRPVLEVLKGSGITNIIVTVVRYFGGTKLGTGGLVHAYSDTAKEVLAHLKAEELIEKVSFLLRVPYAGYEAARRLVEELSGKITEEEFEEAVAMNGTLPAEQKDRFVKGLADLSGGSIEPHFS